VVNIPATVSFIPASKFTQSNDLDGKIMQLSRGSIQIGAKPILLTAGRAPYSPAEELMRKVE
jgi:hypothetical protein